MAQHGVEYIYINQFVPESELQVCREEDGQLTAFYETDGLESEMGQEIQEQQYIDASPIVEEQYITEEAPIELSRGERPQNLEVLESTDGVGGDMKFVMVNQQEVFVVKNNQTQPQKPRRRVTPQSIKKGPKLIQDFLLPHLDNETFGNRLVWVNREQGTFALGWSHKNGADWKSDDCVVFREWDILKERRIQETPHYWMEAKQRFRAALAKVSMNCKSDLEEHKSSKVFQIKWTRETRPQILDKIYTSSKYFKMPPPHSLAKLEPNQPTTSGFSLDQDYAQEEVIPPEHTAAMGSEMTIEVVIGDEFQEDQYIVEDVQPAEQELQLEHQTSEEQQVEHHDAAQQAAAAVLSSRFFTDRRKRARKLAIRHEALKPVEKILRRARRCPSRIYTMCPLCHFLTSNYAVFLRHLMIHRDDLAYTCLHCPKAYKTPESLINHLRVHHSRAPHICFLTNIEETSRSKLKRAEIRLIHQNLKTCGVCAEHCRTQCDLEKHVVELHGKKQLRDVRKAALRTTTSIRRRQKFILLRAKRRKKICNDRGQTCMVVCDGRLLIEEVSLDWTVLQETH